MFDFDDLDEAEDPYNQDQDQLAPSAAVAQATAATNGSVNEALAAEIEALSREADARGDLQTWCLKYKNLGYPLPDGQCRFRVFCFHSAGSAESLWTMPRMNPFLAWVKETKAVELIAVSYPGRDKLLKSKPYESAPALARTLLAVLRTTLADGVPFVFWGHSVGTWVAFEMLMLMRSVGLPMPRAAYLNGMAAPHLPRERRPWRANAQLDGGEFVAQVKAWDQEHFAGPGKLVMEEPIWSEYWMPLMRSDFKLFDEYEFRHAGAAKFDFPIHSLHFEKEHFITKEMVGLWAEWTSKPFDFQSLPGMGHLTSLYVPERKQAYFDKVLSTLKSYAAL